MGRFILLERPEHLEHIQRVRPSFSPYHAQALPSASSSPLLP